MDVAVVAPLTVYHRETAPRARLDRIARGLADRGHEVTVFCARWWGGGVPAFEREGVTYRAVTHCPSPVSFAVKLPLMLARARPDAIHAAHLPSVDTVAAAAGGLPALAPTVVDWYEPAPTAVSGPLARAGSRIVTPSEMVAADAREHGTPTDRTRVLPDWVDFERLRSVDPVATDVVYSRRLDADADLDALLLGLAELRRRDWSATVIGDGPERGTYEQRARDLRIDDRVQFTGALPLDDRLARFRGAHVAVHTAARAPFAHEFLRALAAGCVGIALYRDRSSAHELVAERGRGFRVTEPEGIADRVREAAEFEHRTIDESFADHGRDAVLGRLEDCYRAAVGAGPL
jgi:glycosyltransferase involved in cell wall biosynthesis